LFGDLIKELIVHAEMSMSVCTWCWEDCTTVLSILVSELFLLINTDSVLLFKI